MKKKIGPNDLLSVFSILHEVREFIRDILHNRKLLNKMNE